MSKKRDYCTCITTQSPALAGPLFNLVEISGEIGLYGKWLFVAQNL